MVVFWIQNPIQNTKKCKYWGKSHRKKNSAPKRSFSVGPNFDQIWPTLVQRFDQLFGLCGNFLWTQKFFLCRTFGIYVLKSIIKVHRSIKMCFQLKNLNNNFVVIYLGFKKNCKWEWSGGWIALKAQLPYFVWKSLFLGGTPLIFK